jgi:hypothetical protein
MRVGIMQPYLLPYIGYFQLIYAVDLFVLHDDVQWIKGGWINRNQILLEGKPLRWTLPISKKSSSALINQCKVAEHTDDKKHILRQIRNAYSRAPFFSEIMPMVTDIINYPEKNVAKYILNSLKRLADYLGLSTKLVMSSALKKDDSLKGQERVISMCSMLGATEYVNPIGGVSLYRKEDFKKAGIDLYFLQSGNIEYPQFGDAFVPSLSVIDALMFNSVVSVRKMLSIFILT